MPPQQNIGPTDIADHLEELARPLRQRDLPVHPFDDPVQARLVQAGERVAVDQRRRPLIAHAGAGGRPDRDYAIGAGLADPDAQPVAEIVQQLTVAQHPVGDVVAEQDVVGTTRRGVEEGIELGDAVHLDWGNIEFLGDPLQGFGRQPGQAILHVAQNLQQPGGQTAMALNDIVNGLNECIGFRHGPPPFSMGRSGVVAHGWRLFLGRPLNHNGSNHSPSGAKKRDVVRV